MTLPTSSKAFVASEPATASKTSFPPGCSSKKLVTSYTYTKFINPYGLNDSRKILQAHSRLSSQACFGLKRTLKLVKYNILNKRVPGYELSANSLVQYSELKLPFSNKHSL